MADHITTIETEITPLIAPQIGNVSSPTRTFVEKLTWNNIGFLVCAFLATFVWVFVRIDELSVSAVQTLGVFLSLMIALMITDYPISILVATAISVLVLGSSLLCNTEHGLWILCRECRDDECDPLKDGFRTALLGYSNPTAWMILCAFMIGHAVEKTGLGKRISLVLMKYMGGSLVGLGYAIFLSELALAPFVPSNTARGGGIIMPIVMALAHSLESTPTSNREVGRFLILCGSHSNLLSSTFFITAAGPNPIIVEMAKEIFKIDFSFLDWFLGASLPGAVCILLLPLVLYSLEKPSYDGAIVMVEAEKHLQTMGEMTTKEFELCAVFFGSLLLWITSRWTDMPEAFVAYLALITLLLLGTLKWKDVIEHSTGWDTFFWLSGMLMMADQLSRLGVSNYFGELCAYYIQELTISKLIAAMLLTFSYCFSMYLFSSITGHAIAIAGPLMSAGLAMGCSPWLITILLACFSSLSAAVTSFSTGTVVLYFSQGYFSQSKWFKVGHLVMFCYLIVYGIIGLIWWKILGYY